MQVAEGTAEEGRLPATGSRTVSSHFLEGPEVMVEEDLLPIIGSRASSTVTDPNRVVERARRRVCALVAA